jgi:hypothetical protein
MAALQPQDIEKIDREFTRNLERDRMNERTSAIWPIFLSLSTVFGVIGLQSGEGAYLVGLFPILVSCLAQHINDSEGTLRKNRKFLHKQEQEAGCTSGAEQFFQSLENKSSGGNKRSLRKAFVVTSLLATYLFVSHLQRDHAPHLFITAVVGIELFVIGQTFVWLTYWKPIVTRCKRLWKRVAHRKNAANNRLHLHSGELQVPQ